MNLYDFEMKVTRDKEYSSGGRFIQLNIENEMTLENLINKVSRKMGLKFVDYNIVDNNCHDFMKYVISALNAKRPYEKREVHMIAKLHIPLIVLEQIEENEEYR